MHAMMIFRVVPVREFVITLFTYRVNIFFSFSVPAHSLDSLVCVIPTQFYARGQFFYLMHF